MKAIKKMLMGIAIILFGISSFSSDLGGPFIYIGLLASIIGLGISVAGYYFTEDDT